MFNKRISEGLIINIHNVSYKFTKATVIAIDKAIAHVKKYKKVYHGLMVYIAICLSPYLYDYGSMLVFELLNALASKPLDLVLQQCLRALMLITKRLTILIVVINALKIMLCDIYKNLKNKY